MKKAILLLVIFYGFILGCQQQTKVAEGGQETAKAVERSPVPAYVLVNDLAMWEVKEGKAVYLASLPLGEKVHLLGEDLTALIGDKDAKEYELAKIRRDDGKEGYVRPLYVASNGTLGVVIEQKAMVYAQPKIVSVTKNSLPRTNLIVVSTDGPPEDFVKITAIDPKWVPYSEVYLKKEEISQRESDVQTAILLVVAKSKTDKGQKETILTEAIKAYGDGYFIPEINEALGVGSMMALEIDPFSGTLTVNDDDVNIRDNPDAETGAVIGRLARGDKVEALGVTRKEATIDGVTSSWYQIKAPIEGWVFGAYLTAQ